MTEIRIPKFGMSTVEVEIVALLVSVGQQIRIGDPVAEVETEKVTATFEADVAGVVIEILVAPGETRQVGDVVCRLE